MDLLDRNGFKIIPAFFGEQIISSLTRSIEDSGHSRSRAGMRGAMQIRAVHEIACDPNLLGLANSALGGQAVPLRATYFDKSPDSNWLVVWHQDTALPVRNRREVKGWGPWSVKEGVLCAHAPASALEQVVAIRIHLDDSTAENGSLRVLPSTHTLGVLSDDDIQELAGNTNPYECHVPAGGLLLMRPLLVHASSKVSRGSRRVLHIEYTSQVNFSGGIKLLVQ